MNFPRLHFEGGAFAGRMDAVYAENLHDLLRKVDPGGGEYEKGFFHTSTVQHAGNCYYRRSWTRDAGRGLIELARLGFTGPAQDAADCLLRHIDQDGHWGRTTQTADGRRYEVDGNALVLLGLYNTWKRCGRQPDMARRYLQALRPVVDWVESELKRCRHGFLMPCQTELAGNPNAPYNVVAIYPNYAMRQALAGLEQMAAAAGEPALEARLAELGGGMARAIREELTAGKRPTLTPKGCWINGLDDRDGRAYDFSEWDGTAWPVYHWTRQLPFILQSDLGGLTLQQDEDRQTNIQSYRYLHKKMAEDRFFRRYGFVSNTAWTGTGGRHDDTMAGYGQGFMTQAALILDDVNTYSKLLEGIARLAYDGSVVEPLAYEMNPWLMHECFCYENYEEGRDHTFGTWAEGRPGIMDCPGDEGNLVQQAEILKAFALVAGVDDSEPGVLTVMPRLPWEWTAVTAEEFPFTTADGAAGTVSYRLTHDRGSRTCRFVLQSTLPLPRLDVRVGPFPPCLDNLAGDLRQLYEVEQKENSTWIWLRGLQGARVEQEICLW